MPIYQYSHVKKEPGDIVGDIDSKVIYRVHSVSDKLERTSSGNMAWKLKLLRASEEEEITFRVMES